MALMSPALRDIGLGAGRREFNLNEQARTSLQHGFNRYFGSLVFKLGAFLLSALYSTFSKLWVANIDSSQVVTTDVYPYIGVIVEALNDGVPRSAWLVIGDKSTRTIHSRLYLAYTMIMVTIVQGFLMTVIFLQTSKSLAATFVPVEAQQASLTYVRLSLVQALTSAAEAALSSSTRALDNPDMPLIISSTKFVINIFPDLLLISKFHVSTFNPTVTQAIIRLACDTRSTLAGMVYFVFAVAKCRKREVGDRQRLIMSFSASFEERKMNRKSCTQEERVTTREAARDV